MLWILWFLALVLHSSRGAGILGNEPSISSDSEYLIGSWQAEDGLPQNTVTCAVQTRDGYLWLGTFNGLARFDGVRFVVFGAHNTPELKSNRILTLLEDAAGALWIGTEGGGVSRWHNGRFTTYGVWEGLAHDIVQTLCEDRSGRILIGTLGGLSVWQHGRILPFDQKNPRPQGPVRAAALDLSGRSILLLGNALAWLGSDGLTGEEGPVLEKDKTAAGLYRGPSGTVHIFGKSLLLSLPSGQENPVPTDPDLHIEAVLETARGDLWVGTRRGQLMRRRAGEWVTISWLGGGGPRPVRCLAEDREGNIWVGTDGGGLVRLKPRRLTIVRARNGLANESILSMAEAPENSVGEGGIWLAANCGGITVWSNGVSQPWAADGLMNACVGPLLRTRDGSLWIGTSGEGLIRWKDSKAIRFGRAEGLPDPNILSLFEDREGRLWIGTEEAGVFQYHQGQFRNFTTRDGFPARTITAMAQDPGGDLWIGSNGGGLYRYANGKFSLYSRREGWGGDFIRALLVDREGALWIGTGGSGLTRMKDGWFRTITTRQGLVDDVVSQILEDDSGNLWLGTNRGICRISKNDFEELAADRSSTVPVLAFGKSEGMESLECTGGFHPAGLKTQNGVLWFSTVKGAVLIDPASLATAAGNGRSVPPVVLIEEVWSDGEKLLQTTPTASSAGAMPQLTIRPGYKWLEVRYTALSFTAPEKTRFRYRLEGLDSDWVEAGENRVARFGKLPPGDYRFRVIACNNDGVWDESNVVLALALQPHFWQRRGFFVGSILAAAMLIAGVIRSRELRKVQQAIARLERQHAVERERRRIAEDMHDELGSRLAKVSFLCELAKESIEKPAELGARVTNIAEVSRTALATLDEMVWAVNPQNDTLEHLAAYIGEYAKEFFQATLIECEVQMPPSLPPHTLEAETRHHLFLAVQEALGNVLKHSGASVVRLVMEMREDRFAIAIEDNGCGFGRLAGLDRNGEFAVTSPPGRNGLSNMRRRLESIGAHFHLAPRSAGGIRVTLEVPL